MSSSKRKLDEKHTKMLRELGQQSHNRQCFDCHQRGPTYVNMTIGSFVCTSCSGILVKSISMASFTPDEIDFIKNRGNEYCKKVWLGLYDGDNRNFDGFRDEQQMKDFLILKYEKKRWYVNPSEIARQESLMTQTQTQTPTQSSPSIGSTGSGGNTAIPRNPPPPTSHSLFDTAFPSPSSNKQRTNHGPKNSQSLDLFGGEDPFAPTKSSTSHVPTQHNTQTSTATNGGFADFANFNDSFTPTPQQSAPPPSFGTSLIPPPGAATGNLIPKSATVPASLGPPQPPPPHPASATAQPSGKPDYSALKELDSIFSSQQDAPDTNTNGGGAFNGGGGGSFGAEANSSFNSSWSGPEPTTNNTANVPGGGGGGVFGGFAVPVGGRGGFGLPKSSSSMSGMGAPPFIPSSSSFSLVSGPPASANPFFSSSMGGGAQVGLGGGADWAGMQSGGVVGGMGGPMPPVAVTGAQQQPNPFFGGAPQAPQQQPTPNPFGSLVGPSTFPQQFPPQQHHFPPQQQQQQHQHQQQQSQGMGMGGVWGGQQQVLNTQQPNPFAGQPQAAGPVPPTQGQMNWNPFL